MSARDRSLETSLSPTELLAWASRSLACYALAMNPKFELPPHIKIIIKHLESIERGELTRLVVSIPPRHGKSYLTTVLFVGWYLGRHPDHRVIVACYGQELADDFGRQVRNLIADPMHQAIFPACRLSEDSAAANRFSTTGGGSYVAVGAEGAITGRGADLFLIDDPIKGPEEARSPTSRHRLHEWLAQVARTRMMPGGKMILIQNRWHEDDLAGWLSREHAHEGWKIVSFAAIAPCDEVFRKEGEALWPERYPLEELEHIRLVLGAAAFAALYQQQPILSEGAIFKPEWFRAYQVPPHFYRIVQSWDIGFTTGAQNDYSACTIWGEAEDGFYLLTAWRGRVEFPDLKKQVAAFAAAWKPRPVVILIEETTSSLPLIQALKSGSRLPIVPVRPKGTKIARANAVTPLLAAGRVLLPASAEGKEIFLDEILTFPAGKHDDFTDSMTQALLYLDGQVRGGAQSMLAALSALEGAARFANNPYLRAEMVEPPPGWRPSWKK